VKSIEAHPFFRKHHPVLVMAHRGGRGLAPENTMVAFQQAVALGVDVLELDIHSTADGVLVVIHDETVERTTDGQGPVHGYTLAELKQLDAGYHWSADGGKIHPFRGQGITIPTLEELFVTFPRMRMNIDMKQKAPSIVSAFVRLIIAHDMVEQVLVGSFSDASIARYRRHLLEGVTAASLTETRLFYLLAKLGLTRFYHPAAQAFQIPEQYGRWRIGPRFIEAAHRCQMEVHIWTVNDVADMRRLIDWGVDGIITDYPDRLLRETGD